MINQLLIWSHIHQLGSQGSLLLSARLSRYRERVVSICILGFYKLSRHLYLCLVGLRRTLSLLNGRHFRDRKVILHPFRKTLHPLSFWLLSLLSWRVAFLDYADTLPSKVRSSRVILIILLLILNRDPILMIPDGCVVIMVSCSTFEVDVLRVVVT